MAVIVLSGHHAVGVYEEPTLPFHITILKYKKNTSKNVILVASTAASTDARAA